MLSGSTYDWSTQEEIMISRSAVHWSQLMQMKEIDRSIISQAIRETIMPRQGSSKSIALFAMPNVEEYSLLKRHCQVFIATPI